MPKIKTHSGAKKRFKITVTGKVAYKKVNRGHLLRKKNQKRIRALKQKGYLDEAFARKIKQLMPYSN
ncbi:50S ribosomal protein L35 [Acetomicrobium hydrogeniformans]|uniref:Large ribosomal subunit protein bL35 n=1 Tax=Acetomicrobium hydrogeniformans TaxID=649746 RepID=A0A7V7BY04_9BACT|nr:50S ribosomal protein L35 [Acetomicrobium hydrogeniformans]HHZ04096.1 50S ribosomal protein L35 [Acetomicrobium hydrogeniformans]